MRRSIIICTQFFALHRWEQAPDHRDYLRVNHGHPFTVKLEIDVRNQHREIEFHDVRERLDRFIATQIPLAARWSCESWCDTILAWVDVTYEDRGVSCEVWEDHCFGARVIT